MYFLIKFPDHDRCNNHNIFQGLHHTHILIDGLRRHIQYEAIFNDEIARAVFKLDLASVSVDTGVAFVNAQLRTWLVK
jgi:5-bromo-4-chloroindolyl phosphate hydrolysis protein